MLPTSQLRRILLIFAREFGLTIWRKIRVIFRSLIPMTILLVLIGPTTVEPLPSQDESSLTASAQFDTGEVEPDTHIVEGGILQQPWIQPTRFRRWINTDPFHLSTGRIVHICCCGIAEKVIRFLLPLSMEL